MPYWRVLNQYFHRYVLLLLSSFCAIIFCSGCASVSNTASFEERDPYENYNRKVFAFNNGLDTWLLKPAAKGYKAITPDPVENGISRFFSNLNEIRNVVNDILQWKWGQAANDGGRFLLNSTVGLAGFFDVASKTGLKKSAGEDFGQTLNHWGVSQGPYFMLPFLGPATRTSVIGLVPDWYTDPQNYIDHNLTRYSMTAADLIETRARLLALESTVRGDRYLFIRDAYLQQRDFLTRKGEQQDGFGDSFGDDDDFEFDDFDDAKSELLDKKADQEADSDF